MRFELVSLLALCSLAAGCGVRPKVIDARRAESVTARTGGVPGKPEHSVVQPVDPGTDFLLVTFDAGSRPEGRPPAVPTLTDENGKGYDRPSKEWDQKMGSRIKVWWAVPRAQDSFILEFEGRRFPVKTPGNVRQDARVSTRGITNSEAAVANVPKSEPLITGDAKGSPTNAEMRAFIKFKSEPHSPFASGAAVVFKSALVEQRMESLPVDPELFKSLAPQTQEFLRKQHGGGVTDLLLTTATRGCGTHDAKNFAPGELTVLIPLTASNQPVTVGTKPRPATVVALPTGTVSFSHPDRTQAQGSHVRVDKVDRSGSVVRGRLALEGDLVLKADFVATQCR